MNHYEPHVARGEPHMAHKEPHVDQESEPHVALCEPRVALCEPHMDCNEPHVARREPDEFFFLQCTAISVNESIITASFKIFTIQEFDSRNLLIILLFYFHLFI